MLAPRVVVLLLEMTQSNVYPTVKTKNAVRMVVAGHVETMHVQTTAMMTAFANALLIAQTSSVAMMVVVANAVFARWVQLAQKTEHAHAKKVAPA